MAVINGDGTNRLTSYVDVNGSTQGATSMTASQASSSPISILNGRRCCSSTPASAASATASPTFSPTPSSSSTTGRTVDLAVGVPVGIIALVVLAVFVISTRRLKKKQAHNKELEEKLTYAEMQRHGSMGNDQSLGQSAALLRAATRTPLEMPGEVLANEVDGERGLMRGGFSQDSGKT